MSAPICPKCGFRGFESAWPGVVKYDCGSIGMQSHPNGLVHESRDCITIQRDVLAIRVRELETRATDPTAPNPPPCPGPGNVVG